MAPSAPVGAGEGTLSFPEATLALSPAVLSGRFAGSFTNAAPFVALLTDKTGLPQVLTGTSTQAVMLVKVRNLPLGVEVTSERVHLQILHPTTWYEQKLGERVD